MALIDKVKTQSKVTQTENPLIFPQDSLDKKEITIILELIKNTSFRGDNIETIYGLILKLQNQYTKLEK
tara:strand:+ start:190 stop:396 length:207 start_codon:yes stop_codon:yes gene_type:complete